VFSGATAPLVTQSTRLPQAPLLNSAVRVGAGMPPTLASATRLAVPAAGMATMSLQSMVVSSNQAVVTGGATLKAGQPALQQPAGIRTLPPQSHTVSGKVWPLLGLRKSV